jgi:hypothetical protein
VTTQEEMEKAWNSLNEYIEHGSAEDKVDACREDLGTMEWSELQQLGKEVGIDMSDSPTKTEVLHRLAETHVFTDGPTGDGKVFQNDDGEFKQIVTLDQQSDSNTTMSDETETTTEVQSDDESFTQQPYGDLMNLARSAREQFDSVEIDTDAPKKGQLLESLSQFNPEGSRADGWTIEVDGDRHEVDLLDVQTPQKSSGSNQYPSDKTILYCLTRAATTDDRMEQIAEALSEETDFELREASGGDKFSVVLPKESQEGWVPPEEREVEEEAEEEAESDPEDAEGEGSEESEESESEDSEASEEQSESEGGEEAEEAEDEGSEEETDEESEEEESDEETISRDVVRDRWDENKTKDELYNMAVEEDIENRSEMSKGELIDALLDAKDEVADA